MPTLLLAACQSDDVVVTEDVPISTVAPTPAPDLRGDPLLTPIPSTVGQSALVDIRQRGELRVGILYSYAPFAYLADNGEIEGYEADLLRAVAEAWEIEITFVQVTRQTRLPMLYAGEVDMLAGAVAHRRESEQFLEFTNSYFQSGYGVLIPTGSGLSEPSAIGSSSVGVLTEDARLALTTYASLVGISPAISLVSVGDIGSLLAQGEVSVVIGRRESLMRLASASSDLELMEKMFMAEPYAFAVRRGDAPFRDLLNLTLYSLVDDGIYGELYSSNLYAFAPDPFPVPPGESVYSFQSFPAEITGEESVIERIRRGEPLRVAGLGLSTETIPFDGQPIVDGYNRAVINELARRWNVPVTEMPDSVGEGGLILLESGQADIVMGIRPDLAAMGQVAFSLPYYQRGLRLLHMDDVTVNGVGDLEFKPAAAVDPADVSEDMINDNNGFPDVYVSSSLEDAFKSLIARGVYAVVGDEFSLILMSQSDSRIKVYDALYRLADYSIGLSAADADFQTLLNFTLQDMKADSTLDRLRDQYFSPYLPEGDTLPEFDFDFWPGDGNYLNIGVYSGGGGN